MNTEIIPITEKELEEAALLYVMSVGSYVGFDKSALEISGAAHEILSIVLRDLNKKHEQTTGIREATSLEGIGNQPEQVQGIGEAGRLEEGAEGDGKAITGEPEENSARKPQIPRK